MELKDIKSIAVVGAGLMGHGIAQVFALKGFDVHLFDRDAEVLGQVPERVRTNLSVFSEQGLCSQADTDACLEKLHLCQVLAEACGQAQMIIESVHEDLALKQSLFLQMEEHCGPEVILCSNTSGLPITRISEKLSHRQRAVGTHFWNPPHVVPCVEVIKGEHTSEQAFDLAVEIIQAAGKEPVRVLKDVPGFVGNRIQMAIFRESISLLEQGVASAEDIDKVVKYSFGMRLPFIGPLEVGDLAGHDMGIRVMENLIPKISRDPEVPKIMKDLVAQGRLGVKTGSGFYQWRPGEAQDLIKRRDLGLLELIAIKRRLDTEEE